MPEDVISRVTKGAVAPWCGRRFRKEWVGAGGCASVFHGRRLQLVEPTGRRDDRAPFGEAVMFRFFKKTFYCYIVYLEKHYSNV